MFAQDEVLGHGEVADHAVAHALFGDVGQPARDEMRGRRAGDVLPFEEDLTLRGGPQAVDHLGQLALPIARYARQPQDFPCVDFERHTAQGIGFAVASGP